MRFLLPVYGCLLAAAGLISSHGDGRREQFVERVMAFLLSLGAAHLSVLLGAGTGTRLVAFSGMCWLLGAVGRTYCVLTGVIPPSDDLHR